MPPFRRRPGCRLVARVTIVMFAFTSSVPLTYAAQNPPSQIQTSTVSSLDETQATTTFVDASMKGHDATEFVNHWIRVITSDNPAGFVTRVVSFDATTGTLTLADPIAAGTVTAYDVYHLAETRDALLPPDVNPDDVASGSIGCTPTGTANADLIHCTVLDTTGVKADQGNDEVTVASPTLVVVTDIKKDTDDQAQQNNTENASADKTQEAKATAISLGDGDDVLVNDGVIVATAAGVVSKTPQEKAQESSAPPENKDEDKTDASATLETTAIGVAGDAGADTISSSNRIFTAAASLVLARDLPKEEEADKKAKSSVDVTSTANATATGIDSGDGVAVTANNGSVSAYGVAAAAGVGFAATAKDADATEPEVDGQQKADDEKAKGFTLKGDISATADATGLASGADNDHVTNAGTLTVTASATTLAAGAASVETKDEAAASANANATANASGVTTAAGNDTIINSGTINVTADANAISVQVAFAEKKEAAPAASDTTEEPKKEPEKTTVSAAVDGSTTATSRAAGITADSLTGEETGGTPDFSRSDGRVGVTYDKSETRPAGDDAVTNSGDLIVGATSRANALAAGLSVNGNASAKGTSTADATAMGVDLGGGADTLTTSGQLTVTADATANALRIAVTQKSAGSDTGTGGSGGTPSAAADPSDTSGTDDSDPPKSTVEAPVTATATATGVAADSTDTDKTRGGSASVGGGIFTIELHDLTKQATGTDGVNNSGGIDVTATALTRAIGVAASIDGSTSTNVSSTATATAVALDLGGGNDTLTNAAAGTITATADATATGVGVAIGFKSSTDTPPTGSAAADEPTTPPATPPAAKDKPKIEAAVDASATATASATGVAGDSLATERSRTASLTIKKGDALESLVLKLADTTTHASGDDNVTNHGTIDSTATATTNNVAVGVTIDGDASVKATATADARAFGIDLGAGNDTLINTGQLTVTADATANALTLAAGITSSSETSGSTGSTGSTPSATPAEGETTPPAATKPSPSKSTLEGSATATALAAGLEADSGSRDKSRTVTLTIGGDTPFGLTLNQTEARASGNDTVTNSGAIDATATATTLTQGASLTVGGSASVKNTATATADASGVDLGGGNDTLVDNTGAVTATATADATARALEVGLTAGSSGTGTGSGDGSGSGTGSGSTGTATTPAPGTADTKTDVRVVASGNAESIARAAALSADGTVSDASTTITVTTAFDLETIQDKYSLKYETRETHAVGDDHVTNNAALTADADATTHAAALGVAIDGQASATIRSSADANAAAIDLGGGNDTLINNAAGHLTADADATAQSLDAVVAAKSSQAAKVEGAVEASATADARATGLGADSHQADSSTTLELKVQDAVVLSAEQRQTYAAGDDIVTNDGDVDATATSLTIAVGLGVGVDGNAAVKATSTAQADADGVDLGGGNDSLISTGDLTVSSDATANALSLAIGAKTSSTTPSGSSGSAAATPAPTSKPLKAVANGSANSTARATGIDGDSGAADSLMSLRIEIDSLESINISGLRSDTRVGGNDNVTNHGAIDATATAISRAASGSLGINAAATANVTSTAAADATGIDLGAGDDTLNNTGKLVATADARAQALAASIGVETSSDSGGSSGSGSGSSGAAAASGSTGSGAAATTPKPPTFDSAADASAKAEARATGIGGDSHAGDTTDTIGLSLSTDGLSIQYSNLSTRQSGDDTVINDGAIDAHATASTIAASVAFTMKGSASANTASTTDATGIAIDLGGGQDTVTNTGHLTALADSTALGLSADIVAKKGGSGTSPSDLASSGFWQGGTKAEATATGIDAAGTQTSETKALLTVNSDGLNVLYETRKDNVGADAADIVINNGSIDATANATATAVNASASAEGKAAAVTHSDSKADAAGIIGGQGDDVIHNLGDGVMTVTAGAQSNAGTLAMSGKGAAIAADALWNSGTKADATAVGIDGDGGATEVLLVTGHIGSDGVQVVVDNSKTAASGADTIVNTQQIDVAANATAPSVGVALEAKKGLAATVTNVTTDATATAIRGGDGNDSITNDGALTSTTYALSIAGNVAVAKEGVAAAGGSVWDGGTKAVARSIGIDADGGFVSDEQKTTLTVNGSGATIVHSDTKQGASGQDTVINHGAITTTATAETDVGAVAVVTKGLSAAFSQSTSTAAADAIRGGDASDFITNTGALSSTAEAKARSLNIAVTTEKGVAIAGNGVWDGGVKADATAVGINGDGGAGFDPDTPTKSTTTIKVGGGDLIGTEETKAVARGDDVIVNSGQIDVKADARAPEVSVAVAVQIGGAAISTSTATSSATAIDAGDGDDQVLNTGKLTADAYALAVAVNGSVADQGVAIAANDSWNGGVDAAARARGIDGGAGFDVLTNDAEILAKSQAIAPAASAAIVTSTGAAAAVSTATAKATSTAIDAGGGVEADHVFNLNNGATHAGKLTADASAMAFTANVAIANQGLAIAADAVWDGGTKAEATAKGIDAGQGVDTVANASEIHAISSATTVVAAVSVTNTGVAGATTTSTATSKANAIDTGDGQDADVITNAGALFSDADAIAGAAAVAIVNAGVAGATDAAWDGGTTADATAKGVASGNGADIIINTGAIGTDSRADAGSLGVAVAVSGVAAALAQSTATSSATAIDTGDGHDADRVFNTGKLMANADALAISAAVSVTTAGLAVGANAVWDGGTTSDAAARGIALGAGADSVTNSGRIDATAISNTGAASVTVAVSGVAGAIATATSKAFAAAIDAGDGLDNASEPDSIVNHGQLTADATARAGTITVGVTTAGLAIAADSSWNGGTKAEATTKTVATGDGADVVANDGDVNATATADTVSVGVSVAVAGLAAANATSTSVARSAAIDTGAGDDTIATTASLLPGQTGKLTAGATANAITASISVTPTGAAVAADSVWDGGTKADADAAAIDTGSGTDAVTNAAEILATSNATTVGLTAAVTVFGVSGAVANAMTTSSATAIRTGTDETSLVPVPDDDTVVNTGTLAATANATAVSAAVGFSFGGVSVAGNQAWDGGTTSRSTADGIATGRGGDDITNSGIVGATADANTVAASASVTVFGVAGAASTATSDARATAIDGGNGNDLIRNLQSGVLTTYAESTAVGVKASITGIGVSASIDGLNGGTTGTATAIAIDGGKGQDSIVNHAVVNATADATAFSNSVAISALGAAAAVSTATTASANAKAIDGGDGADVIANDANVTATSRATGTVVNVAVTAAGVSAALDATWNGGTTATATATGIDGGAGDDTVLHAAGAVTADAASDTHSVSVSVSGAGLVGAAAGSTSTARATAIDGGDGGDVIGLAGGLSSKADSSAAGVSVSATLVGDATLGSFIDSLTKAEAFATGIAGGASGDRIETIPSGSIGLTSKAVTEATTVSVAIVGNAAADAHALAIANATGLDGGDGADVLDNRSAINGVLTAESRARAVSVSSGGGSGDASGTAQTIGVGLDGGNDGDVVTNAGAIALTGTATALSQTVTISLGSSISDAGGTASATFTGIAGGAGDDTVVNTGAITLTPTANASGQNLSVSVNASIVDANALAATLGVGLAGGDGQDDVTNAGAVNATAASTTTAISVGAHLLGGVNTSNITADAAVTGVDGGNDDDHIVNTVAGDIHATATASTTAVDLSITGIGVTNGEVQTTPVAKAVGLDGGAGHDLVVNDGKIDVSATATSTSARASVTVGGSVGAKAGTTALVTAVGLAGGQGDDVLIHNGLFNDLPGNDLSLKVNGSATATVDGAAWTLAGGTVSDSALAAIGQATGLAGNDGRDTLRNNGTVIVTLESTLDAKAGGKTIFGGAGSQTQLSAQTNAFGLAGGGGGDTIETTARSMLDVSSTATVTSTNAAVSFAASDLTGTPAADALLLARARSTGIDGGLDVASIDNLGGIKVNADSVATVTGSASATVAGGAKTVGVGKTDATAIGIQGGAAANVINNAGVMDVTATGNATVTNNSKSGELFSDATTRSDVASVATAKAISAGAGDNVVTNDATLRTTALAIGQGFAYASGSHVAARVGIGDGKADAKATVESNGFGISLGDGANRVLNNALLAVSSQATTVKTLIGSTTVCTQESVGAEPVCHEEASPVNLDANPTYASANGNGVNGVGIATSSGKATSNAVGVDVGHGRNVIVNDRNGTIDITADPVAKALAIADADLNGDAKGTATATAVAFAAGIRGGDGANDITNLGQLTVRAVPTAQAKAQVSAGFCIDLIFTTWCGGGTGTGKATASFTANAVGIQTGDGANRIVNDGTLTVTAEPTVDDFAVSVIAANDGKKTLATSVTASAIGIETGNGNNDVLNDTHGVIDVEAKGIGCSSCQSAFGIQTGTGNDVIVNNGAISAMASQQITTAIDSGDGNDRVVLGTGSHTSGDVLLGAGNDRLVWSAAASLTDGIADGGAAGVDVFALGGSANGTFQLSQIGNPFQGFERFHKEGSSTWTLLGDRQIDWTVENGHLAVSGLITGTIDTTAPDAPGLVPVIDVLSTGIVRRNDGLMAAVRIDTGGVLDNDGLVDATTLSGVGVETIGQGGLVVNAGGIHSTGVALKMNGVDGTLSNSGVVLATGLAPAITFGGNDNTVVNEVGGQVVGLNGLAVQGGAGNDHVTNHGRLAGGVDQAIDLGAGDDDLTISATSLIDGVSHGGAGFDTLAIGGATGSTFNLSTIGPRYDGFELFRKQGPALWNLIGTATSDWIVDEATLRVDGNITGTIQTNALAHDAFIDLGAGASVGRPGALAAVILNGDARFDNAGSVAGGGLGVELNGADNRVNNGGDIHADGVALLVNGTSNVLNNDGEIRGGATAVTLAGGGNALVNSGTIVGSAQAVSLGGDHNTMNNGGDIHADGVALLVSGTANLLDNTGEIRGGATAVTLTGSGNSLTNRGILAGDVALSLHGGVNALVNSGTIAGSGQAVLLGGNSNTMNNGGSIHADDVALLVSGNNNVLTNDGDIRAGATAVTLTGTANSFVNQGVVAGGLVALRLEGGGNALVNSGTIGGSAQAMVLGGNGNTLTNVGTVNGTSAIRLSGADDAVVNLGLISANTLAIEGLAGGNRIENRGTIVSAGGRAVDLTGDANVLNNFSDIKSGGSAVALTGNLNRLFNDGTIAGFGEAVFLGGRGNTLTNFGIVDGELSAIRMSGGDHTVLNLGLISSGGLTIEGSAGADRIDNYGTIMSATGRAIDLAGGDDTLYLDTSGRLAGSVAGGAGFDLLRLGGIGTVRADLDVFTGFEHLRKEDAGSWAFTGSADMSWDLTNGQLVIDGALTGPGIVWSGGRLGGSGTVGGFTNQGIVAPGSSIGTLRVLGDYVQAPDGTLQIEGSVASGLSDRLSISGHAALGGTLDLVPESRPFGIATEYGFLTATNGVSGTFGVVQSGNGILDASVEYGTNGVTAVLIRNDVSFRKMGNTRNLVALGAALDRNKRAMARGDFKSLMDEFLVLEPAAQTAALGTLSGELHATTLTTLRRSGEWFFEASVDRRLSAQRVAGKRTSVWTDAIRFTGSIAADGNAQEVSYGASGLAAGVDRMLSDRTRLGASMAYSPGSTELEAGGGEARSRSYYPALYGDYDTGRWSVGGAFGYGRHDVDTTRAIHVGSIERRTAAGYGADQYFGLLKGGWSVPGTGQLSVKAFGELRYATLLRPSFDETSAAGGSLTVLASDSNSFRPIVGFHTAWEPRVGGSVRVRPELKAAWSGESTYRPSELTGALSGSTWFQGFQRFTVAGATEARNRMLLTTGASVFFGDHGSAFVMYDGALSDLESQHGVSAGVRVHW